MQYRRLGSSGLQLSALSFGAWLTFGAQIGRSTARELIAAAWDNLHPDSRIAVLPRRFWVSSLVILRRAHELGRLSTPEFHELVDKERAKLQKAKKPGGGDFYRTLVVRMGSRFTYSVVGEVNQNRLLIRDAARLLSISPRSLAKFAEMAK